MGLEENKDWWVECVYMFICGKQNEAFRSWKSHKDWNKNINNILSSYKLV